MKKIITLLLVLCLTAGLVCLNVAAEPENLVPAENADFESGEKGDWKTLAGGKLSVEDNPDGEGKCLRYEVGEQSYSTPMLDVRSYIQAAASEEVTVYGSFDIYSSAGDPNAILRLRTNTEEGFSQCASDGKNYCTLGNKLAGTEGAWTHYSYEFTVCDEDFEVTDEPWNICFDNLNGGCSEYVYLDNFYLGLDPIEEDVVEQKTLPEKKPIAKQSELLIGVSRWDAFEKSTPKGTDPCSQVARVLSPAQYHGQAPFFAHVEDDGTVSFPEYTVETWEAEAKYAVDAGLSYFAYLWYASSDPMSTPRKLHLQSSHKDDIKFAAILENYVSKDQKTKQEVWDAIKDSCYLRLDGRPVIFLYGLAEDKSWTKDTVQALRQDAANQGIEEALYLVGMFTNTGFDKFSSLLQKDIDAVSWYSTGATEKDEPYADLAKACEDLLEAMGKNCMVTKTDIIPSFTAGRDTRARIQTGVTWVDGDPNANADALKPYGNKYSLPPTMTELQTHVENCIRWVKDHSDITVSNMISSYGWNEHEEGGWLCPTIAVDENGKQLFNADGTPKINTERLDAVKAAIENTKNDVPGSGTAEPGTATAEPAQQDKNEDSGSFPVWWIAIPVAVVVIAAVVVIVVVSAKKKKGKEE